MNTAGYHGGWTININSARKAQEEQSEGLKIAMLHCCAHEPALFRLLCCVNGRLADEEPCRDDRKHLSGKVNAIGAKTHPRFQLFGRRNAESCRGHVPGAAAISIGFLGTLTLHLVHTSTIDPFPREPHCRFTGWTRVPCRNTQNLICEFLGSSERFPSAFT